MGVFKKIGKWAGDRWGKGPSMSGLKSSVKGTAKFVTNPAVMGVGGALLSGGLSLPALAAGGLGAAKAGIKGAILGGDGKLGMDDLGRGLKSVGGWAKNNPDLILGGLSAYEGINAQNDANKYRDRALGLMEQEAAARGQFRDMGMQRLGNVQRPDLGGIFAGSGNPYTQAQRPQGGPPPAAGGMPTTSGPIMPVSEGVPPIARNNPRIAGMLKRVGRAV